MKNISNLFLYLILLSLTSCATVITTTKQCITVNTEPKGAKVYIDGKEIGVSPLFVQLYRNKNYIVKIELDNYKTQELILNKETNRWTYLNFIVGPYGFPGFGIDYLTGACYKLIPNDLNIVMSINTNKK